MDFEFTGPIWFWRGPAPWHFVTVPPEECAAIDEVAVRVSYGWGMIPVTVRLGGSSFATSLWPKDGAYIVPIKTAVRRSEGVEVDDMVTVRVSVALR
ncbi:DUF1905 domain-containing protein [Microbacteriaceae bacterium VKM Ac-2854]|nr:DUF1905 domain-containing protein [Microbacteriaceae bacterium VKM Ac-2854]